MLGNIKVRVFVSTIAPQGIAVTNLALPEYRSSVSGSLLPLPSPRQSKSLSRTNSRPRSTLLLRVSSGSSGTSITPVSRARDVANQIHTNRGLEFTCAALSKSVANSSEELADSFRNAYSTTLKPHHSFLVKPVFSAAMSACPYRADFYAKLGQDQEKVSSELRTYLAALDKIVGILKGFTESKDAKW